MNTSTTADNEIGATIHDTATSQKITRHDWSWILSLFGTAVGAGILFLPIEAGMGGFWPLMIILFLIGPMTYLAHRALARFVLSSSIPDADVTVVVEEHFGKLAGKLITGLYFLAIYPILLIYGVGITNTVESFITHQLGMAAPARWLLSLILIVAMMSVVLTSERVMLKVTQWLVYPLIAILFGISVYLIPSWQTAALNVVPSTGHFITTLWLTVPVLVFAFNHSPAISSFSLSQRRRYGDNAVAKTDRLLKRTTIMLVAFVMFFVFSCVLSLTPMELAEAKASNLPIVSYLANHFATSSLAILGPIVALVAIASSFFGHYLGAREGLNGIISKTMRSLGKTPKLNSINRFTSIFFLLSLWLVSTLNPSILGMIESLSGPVIAIYLFLMPMYAIHKIPAMQRYKGVASNIFITIMGLFAISSILVQWLS